MKVAAIVVLLAVAVCAKPPGPPKKDGGDLEEKATDVFMSMVKLCMRLADMADDDDKRSWDAVFGLYGQVCEGIKKALEEQIQDAEAGDDKRSGPSPTGRPDSRGPRRGSGADDDDDKRSGPFPTGMPESRRPKGKGPRRGSGGVDDDKRSGPFPTGMPDSRGPKGKGPRRGSGGVDDDDKRSGPFPTGMPESRRPKDKDSRSVDGPMSPEQQLLKLCFDLAELGKALEANSDDKRSLEQALMGMEQVCLAAFVEAKSDD